MKSITLVCSLFLVLVNSLTLYAQEESISLEWFVGEMLSRHRGITLCPDQSLSDRSIGLDVSDYLSKSGKEPSESKIVATAIWTLYPCPFSPYRSELKLAGSKDIEGVWLYPESSQQLRFGPLSTQQPPTGPIPVKCSVIGYYPNGEIRTAIMAGSQECPFTNSSALDEARKNPRVSSWSIITDGRISIDRSDVQNYVEEWDVYLVMSPFAFNDVQFEKGDLIEYMRKERGNSVNASWQFRHLKRLN